MSEEYNNEIDITTSWHGYPKSLAVGHRYLKDIYEECASEIKETLFAWAWPKIQKATTSGLPEWYKKLLLEESFNEEEDWFWRRKHI